MSSALTQSGPYMPDDDFGLVSWMRNFARKIEAMPTKYGLSAGDAAAIVNSYEQFQQAFERTQDPMMRTPPAIAAKDTARASAKGTMRTYAGLIRANIGVDNQDLIGLGMHARHSTRRPVPAPRSAPILAVRAAFPLAHQMTYQVEGTQSRRRKPYGVQYLSLHWFVLEPGEPVTNAMLDPRRATQTQSFTKTPFLVNHREEDAGKTAVYFAKWVTGTGLTGPWSVPCWFTIAAGGNALDQSDVKETASTESTMRRTAA